MKRVGTAEIPKDFEWLDGTGVDETYNNFADGEPDTGGGSNTVGVFVTMDGTWKSDVRIRRIPFVCQRPISNCTMI